MHRLAVVFGEGIVGHLLDQFKVLAGAFTLVVEVFVDVYRH